MISFVTGMIKAFCSFVIAVSRFKLVATWQEKRRDVIAAGRLGKLLAWQKRSTEWLSTAAMPKLASQVGEFGVFAIVEIAIGVLVIGTVVVALWPTITGTNTSVAALTQTDTGTKTLQSFWPIIITVVGVGIGAGVILWVLRKFDIIHF